MCLKHFVFDVCSNKRHKARWVHKSTFHPHPASLQTTTGPTATTHEGIAGLYEVAEGVAHISFDPNFAIMARLPDGTRVRGGQVAGRRTRRERGVPGGGEAAGDPSH